MKNIAAQLSGIFTSKNSLVHQLEHLLGFTPKYLPYYETALMHRSKKEDLSYNNERLEFLGDAILGAVVAEYLFKKYPTETEGFLTELRSRIVRRETLNQVAKRMGIHKLVQYNHHDSTLSKSHIFGNAFEALIGAVYLDKGYARTKKFVLKQFIKPYIDMDELASTDINYKNQLLSWAQKKNHSVQFELIDESMDGKRKLFTVAVLLNGESISIGKAHNKKDAGKVAAQMALAQLNIGE